MVLTRIRVRFDFTPVNYARKCWFVFDSDQCSLVGDVAYLISAHFELQNNHEHNGIELYMDDYLIPANESSEIIRDNDVIELKAARLSPDKTSPSVNSSDGLQPKSKKRKKSRSKESANHKQASPDTLATATPKVNTPMSSATPASLPKPPRPLRTVSTKSVSGGVHTKFHSSSSDSSSSESSSEAKQSLKQTLFSVPNDKLISKTNSVSQKKSLVTNKTVHKSPGRNARSNTYQPHPKKTDEKTTPVLRSSQQTNKTVGKHGDTTVKMGRRQIPSHVIVGGPDDVHTTRSKVYKRTVNSNNDSSMRITVPSKQSNTASETAVRKANRTTDITDTNRSVAAQTVTSVPVCDYSTLPDLQGAPRVGDKLAFKLLELSSSCTPEVSDYKEANVLSYDVATKTVKMKYTETTLRKLQEAESDSPSILAKFMLDNEQEEETIHLADSSHKNEFDCAIVELSLDSLILPKLLNN